jgi:hypothetical protein
VGALAELIVVMGRCSPPSTDIRTSGPEA